MSSGIYFHNENIQFNIKHKISIKKWITYIIKKYNHNVGFINYIFCSDEFLYNINLNYLKHNTYTDVITFNYNNNKTINSDIYISIERVKYNAQTFYVSHKSEILRVMIHGIYHLLGYEDHSEIEKEKMKSLEDYAINLYKNHNYLNRNCFQK